MLKLPVKFLVLCVLLAVFMGCQSRPQSKSVPAEQPILERESSIEIPLAAEIEPEILKDNQHNEPSEKPAVEAEKQEQEAEEPTVEEAEQEQTEAQSEEEPQTEPEEKVEDETSAEQEQETSNQEKPEEEINEDDEKNDEELIKDDTPQKPSFYEKCDFVLSTYVDENGLVDYETLRRKRLDLIAAAKEFENIEPLDMMTWSENEKIALWINAYNIFTLKLIVDNYPIQPRWYILIYPDDSIMQIPGAWTKHYFEVMGIEYTLQEIEREILLQKFKDPRICFALSEATLGGAFLRNEVYLPEKLDEQLDEQVQKYLASPKGFKMDHTNKVIYLSNIFSTRKNAFIEKYADVKKYRTRKPHTRACLNFLTEYVDADNIKYFESDKYSVKFLQYDWQLNEQPRK